MAVGVLVPACHKDAICTCSENLSEWEPAKYHLYKCAHMACHAGFRHSASTSRCNNVMLGGMRAEAEPRFQYSIAATRVAFARRGIDRDR